jgi:methylamine dehydrogenase accessory protein MauD
MLNLLLPIRLLLCGVFLVAGISKLWDRPGSRQSLIDFGVPNALAGLFAVLLPLLEIMLAIALIPAAWAWTGGVGTLALLGLFLIAIGVSLARGRRPDCHCFGQLHSQPIGWDLMARNAALAALAALVVYKGPAQPDFSLWFNTSFYSGGSMFPLLGLTMLALLILQTWLIFQLVQQGGRVLLRLEALEKQTGGKQPEAAAQPPAPAGLPVGETAPEFELEDLDGASQSLERLRTGGKPVLLLFTNQGCGPCADLLPEIGVWQRQASPHFNLALLSQGAASENAPKIKEHEINTVLLQREREVTEAYQALATPSAVLVRPDGTIGSAVASGAEAIRSLVSNTINESLAGLVSIQLQAGDTVPPLVYPDLDGQMVKLSQLRGKPGIFLFWNPGCGFCQQMTEEVKLWERKLVKSKVPITIISTGTVEANRKQGFRSTLVIDQNFSAGKAFGVGGTPSALAIDADGKVASKVAVGRQEIVDSIFTSQTADTVRA